MVFHCPYAYYSHSVDLRCRTHNAYYSHSVDLRSAIHCLHKAGLIAELTTELTAYYSHSVDLRSAIHCV
ncbi:hypothetical protein L211DRAFT_842957, partial [Terfezia boudieri ATCC MYA-4762]